jgi:hypothetical protein
LYPVSRALFETDIQVRDIDTSSPSRVCDSCFQKIAGHISGRLSVSTHTRRSSVFKEALTSRSDISMADFDIVKHLGRGAFGQVLEVSARPLAGSHCGAHSFLQVKDKKSQKSYALKVTSSHCNPKMLAMLQRVTDRFDRSWKRKSC